MKDALKVLFLVNAGMAVIFAIFYQLVMLCLQVGISPWWALVVMAGGAWFLCKPVGRARHVEG